MQEQENITLRGLKDKFERELDTVYSAMSDKESITKEAESKLIHKLRN